jgi:serine/threonine protein kinase
MNGQEMRRSAATAHNTGVADRSNDGECEPTTASDPDWLKSIQSGGDPGQLQSGRLPEAGERIGQYELIRELGRGGMGAVYLARDTRLGRRVAIKFLQSAAPELTARFILEARATARCHHDNIIVIHDVGEHRENPYMVLEFLQGNELTGLIPKGRGMPPARVVELMVPVARALVCAHEHGIVHRDLKPDNIFVTESGTVKVLDFGIAKLLQNTQASQGGPQAGPVSAEELAARLGAMARDSSAPAPELTGRGAIMGTLPFMSPEQWGLGGIDHRTDIWAMGILLFEMLAGRHPLWPSKGFALAITAMVEEPMPRLRAVAPQVPDELAEIVDRCLLKDKLQRPASAQELVDALEPLLPGRFVRRLGIDQSPYAGLSSFQEADAGRFFGRQSEIAAAVTRLRDQPLFGVVGPSGVGKSSFVRAGVVPALKGSGERWSSLVIRPGRQPVEALAQVVETMLGAVSNALDGTALATRLAHHESVAERLRREPGYLGTVMRSRARQSGQRLLLFIDQFEELYTLVDDPAERRAYTAALAGAADDATAPVRVVLAIRSDFLDRVPEDVEFMAELSRGLFFLMAPGRAGLKEALTQPAEMAGCQFETPDMVEHMLDHLEHTPGALPLLQFAATKLWDSRDTERRLLTRASYDALGGIAGALAGHADAVVAELPPRSQSLARALFLRLITPERTRALVALDELGDVSESVAEVQGLLEHLVHARLLVIQTGGGPNGLGDGAAAGLGPGDALGDGASSGSVEIVHESLIHSWPLLGHWLDANQDDAVFLDQLRNAARQWDKRGRRAGLLWRGEAMEEARRWHRHYRGDVPPVQRAYLQAVFRQAARSARLKRLVLAGIIGLLSVMVAAAAVALVVIRDAQKESEAQTGKAEARLVRAQAAEAEAQKERERAVTASERAESANTALESKNSELVAAVEAAEKARQEAEAARRRAEKSKRKARRDRRRAQSKEREALAAEGRARDANGKLQRLLESERERIRRLEEQGARQNAIRDISVEHVE